MAWTVTIRGEKDKLAVLRPGVGMISALIETKTLGDAEAAPVGLDLGHVNVRLAIPPKEGQFLSISRKAEPSLPVWAVGYAFGFADHLVRAWVNLDRPEI
jgi:hypothetical protein